MPRLLVTLLFVGASGAVHAYTGPGSGIGFLGSLWIWLVGIFVTLSAIILWPFRRALRRAKARRKADLPEAAESNLSD